MSGTTPKTSRQRVAGALLILAATVLAVWAWLSREPEAAQRQAAPTQEAPTPVQDARSEAHPSPALPLVASPVPSEPPASPSASPPPVTPPPPQMPQHILAQLREEDALMGAFQSYHQRALLDAPSLAQYQAILSSPENIASLEQALRSAGEGEMTLKEHFHRLMRIDFLKAALTWKQNPARAQLLETVSRLVLEDNFAEGQEVERQYALAGGKMELYHLLAEHDPSMARMVADKARGTRLEKLVTFLAERDQRLRAQGLRHADP